MQYWMVKTEPGEFSFADLVRDGKTVWDGVRNHQAKKNLGLMKIGDRVLVYHSVTDKEVVGLAEVSREAYPDPTENPTGTWLVVEIKPVKPFKQPVSLQTVKETPELAEIALVRQSRLSVMPLEQAAFERLLTLGGLSPVSV
jgi:predicted RNA-binding protein with PUA-like domain